MYSLLLLMLLAHAATLTTSTDENISDLDSTKSVFILAGQSNMAGRANVIDGGFGIKKRKLYRRNKESTVGN
ncbi:hypothetical protein ABFS83_03G044100 [Erythranthe nasuta]